MSSLVQIPLAANASSAKHIAEQTGRHPTSTRSLIKTVTHPELIRIWNATNYIVDTRVRRKAEEQLTFISKRKFQISLICESTIAYPASVYFPKPLVRRTGIRLLRRIQSAGDFSPEAMHYLERKLRTVRSKALTVGELLINHRRFDNAFDPDHPHQCTCHLHGGAAGSSAVISYSCRKSTMGLELEVSTARTKLRWSQHRMMFILSCFAVSAQ
eukprot:SAG11_NODE_3690_length_2278_cov_3.691602_1_plen_214_part_00